MAHDFYCFGRTSAARPGHLTVTSYLNPQRVLGRQLVIPPYLQSSRGQKHYKIVALLNSSVEAAEAAKKSYNLPNAKAYRDPQALAADQDVDLVVVTTRADVHYKVAEPSIRANKPVFIEWPLTHNLESSLQLVDGKSLPDSIIGLQGTVGPITLRLKEILASGLIGKVYNSDVQIYATLMPRDGLPESLTYLADREVDGHSLNITCGHVISFVHEVLGDWEDFDVKAQIQRPEYKLLGTDKTLKNTVPDYLSIHGTIKNTKGVTVPGAILSASYRLGTRFNNEPGLVWTINGEKGELRLTASGPYIFSGYSFDQPVKIEHHDHTTDQVKDLGWDWQEWQKEYQPMVRCTAELYERYAEWVESGRPTSVAKGREWPTLDYGVTLMKEFDALYKKVDPSW